MTMAVKLRTFLAQKGIAYDIVSHRHTSSSINSAYSASIPADKLVKPVILDDAKGYIMAIIPATHHVKIGKLNHVLHRNMGLTDEDELRELFTDCEFGAIPPVGEAYGIDTVVDSRVDKCSDVYIESGDHQELLHIRGNAFRKLMKHSKYANIS